MQVVEALTNEKINFTKEEWQLLVVNKLTDVDLDGEWVQWLARVPDFVQRTKYMDHSSAFEHQILVSEVDALCGKCRSNVEALRFRLVNFSGALAAPELVSHFHTNNLRILALTLASGIMLNRIMSALLPMNTEFAEESHRWAKEINQLAESAMLYRPLGSSAMILCLPLAWMAALDTVTQDRSAALLADYEWTCLGVYTACKSANLTNFQRRLTP